MFIILQNMLKYKFTLIVICLKILSLSFAENIKTHGKQAEIDVVSSL